MTFQYTSIVFVGLLNLSLYANSTDCLVGYYTTIDGNCTACPPGKAGTNCSEDCQNRTYGFKCAYTCECTDCDPVTGCPSTTINAVGVTESVKSTDVPSVEGPAHTVISLLLLIVLLVVILAIVGFNFAATMVLLLRFSTNLHLPQHQDKTSKESSTRGPIEEIEMSPDGYESPIIPTERQEMRVYTELH